MRQLYTRSFPLDFYRSSTIGRVMTSGGAGHRQTGRDWMGGVTMSIILIAEKPFLRSDTEFSFIHSIIRFMQDPHCSKVCTITER